MTKGYNPETGVGAGLMPAFLRLAQLICAQEPGLGIMRKAGNWAGLEWVPPSDEPYHEHIEIRGVRAIRHAIQPRAFDVRKAEFFIAGEDEEALTVDADSGPELQADPYAEYFLDRFSGIYDQHRHDVCLAAMPPDGKRLVNLRALDGTILS